jgi:hypothetical protein
MSYKQMPRLGSAIASTILSVFWAVLLVGVDKAQAAVLTYNFETEWGEASGFFKVDNSSLTGIGYEHIAVSEGRLDTFLNLTFYGREEAKEYYNLAEGATALFYQGEFGGLYADGSDIVRNKYIYVVDEPYGSFSFYYSGHASWSIFMGRRSSDDMRGSVFSGYKEGYVTDNPNSSYEARFERYYVFDTPVNYTLVNTETVPEPLTSGGTALALAGLSWLKHKKKMAA